MPLCTGGEDGGNTGDTACIVIGKLEICLEGGLPYGVYLWLFRDVGEDFPIPEADGDAAAYGGDLLPAIGWLDRRALDF